MQSIWTLVVIVGPILFIAAIIFVTVRNKLKSTPQDEAFTERATKQRKEEEANAPKEVDGPLG
jgi:heme/copper-type cytochrome/quinol oxidase subunit 2